MRLIRLPGASFAIPYRYRNTPETIHFALHKYHITICRESISFSNHGGWLWQNRPVVFDKDEYILQSDSEAEISAESFDKGLLKLIDEAGNTLNLTSEAQASIVSASYTSNRHKIWRNNRIYKLEFDQNTFEFTNTLVDIDSGEKQILVEDGSKHTLLDDGFLVYEADGHQTLSCYNNDLSLRWKFKPAVNVPNNRDLYCGPEIFEDLVIFTHGWSRMEAIQDPRRKNDASPVETPSDSSFHDAYLFALDLNDGNISWEAVIPKSIDNLRVSNGLVYLSSANEIHILDARTGKTNEIIETDLSDDYNRLTNHKSFLEIAGDYLYFCHATDGCILIYRLEDLKLLKRLNLPHPHTPSEFLYFNETNGKSYFLTRRYLLTSVLPHSNGFSILEIDPQQQDTELEVYEGPPVNIELKPAEKDSREVEVWIDMKDIPLNEALVYAEYHGGNQAYHHGHQEFPHNDYHETPNFNGMVHLRYSGSDRPTKEVKEKLKKLTEDFKKWAEENYAYASTKPEQKCALEAEYLT